MRKILLFTFLISLLVSCDVDETLELDDVNGVQIICDDINEPWAVNASEYIDGDTFEYDINSDGIIDFTFSSFGIVGSSGWGWHRKILSNTGFEFIQDTSFTYSWTYNTFQSPDTVFDTSSYIIFDKLNNGDTINNQMNFFQAVYYFNMEGGSSLPYPFPNGSVEINPWLENTEGFIGFRNQNMGIIGWIKINLYNSVTIIRSHYKITNTLVIDESVCQ